MKVDFYKDVLTNNNKLTRISTLFVEKSDEVLAVTLGSLDGWLVEIRYLARVGRSP